MTKGQRILVNASIALGSLLVLSLLALLVFRVMFVNYIDNYELGYKYDARTGKVEILGKRGYVVTAPIVVTVHTIDLRPMQVCINANNRVLNCKLVKFNPDGLNLFLQWHGRANYDAATLNPILLSYAYDGSGRAYPFLTVLRELKPENDKELDDEIQKEMLQK